MDLRCRIDIPPVGSSTPFGPTYGLYLIAGAVLQVTSAADANCKAPVMRPTVKTDFILKISVVMDDEQVTIVSESQRITVTVKINSANPQNNWSG